MDCKVVIPRRIRFLISVVNRCIDKLTQQSLINHIKCKLNSKINIRPKRYGRYRTAAAVASLGKFPNSGDCPASMCPTIIVTETEAEQHRLAAVHAGSFTITKGRRDEKFTI